MGADLRIGFIVEDTGLVVSPTRGIDRSYQLFNVGRGGRGAYFVAVRGHLCYNLRMDNSTENSIIITLCEDVYSPEYIEVKDDGVATLFVNGKPGPSCNLSKVIPHQPVYHRVLDPETVLIQDASGKNFLLRATKRITASAAIRDLVCGPLDTE